MSSLIIQKRMLSENRTHIVPALVGTLRRGWGLQGTSLAQYRYISVPGKPTKKFAHLDEGVLFQNEPRSIGRRNAAEEKAQKAVWSGGLWAGGEDIFLEGRNFLVCPKTTTGYRCLPSFMEVIKY